MIPELISAARQKANVCLNLFSDHSRVISVKNRVPVWWKTVRNDVAEHSVLAVVESSDQSHCWPQWRWLCGKRWLWQWSPLLNKPWMAWEG